MVSAYLESHRRASSAVPHQGPYDSETMRRYETLVAPHIRGLHSVARGVLIKRGINPFYADDVVQETLLNAWENFDKFRGINPEAWLYLSMGRALRAMHRQITPMPSVYETASSF